MGTGREEIERILNEKKALLKRKPKVDNSVKMQKVFLKKHKIKRIMQ